MTFEDTLSSHIKARYSLIGIQTQEEERIISMLKVLSTNQNAELYFWTHASGLTLDLNSSSDYFDKTTDFKSAVDKCKSISSLNEDTLRLFVFADANAFLGSACNPIYRR